MSPMFFIVSFVVSTLALMGLITLISETTAEDSRGRADMGAQDVIVITGIALLAIGVAAAILL